MDVMLLDLLINGNQKMNKIDRVIAELYENGVKSFDVNDREVTYYLYADDPESFLYHTHKPYTGDLLTDLRNFLVELNEKDN